MSVAVVRNQHLNALKRRFNALEQSTFEAGVSCLTWEVCGVIALFVYPANINFFVLYLKTCKPEQSLNHFCRVVHEKTLKIGNVVLISCFNVYIFFLLGVGG